MRKFLVVGPASWRVLDLLVKEGDQIITDGKVDIADRYCEERKVVLFTMEAEWDTHNSYAGYINNEELLDTHPDIIIAFWDKRHPGVRDIIKKSNSLDIPIFIWYVE